MPWVSQATAADVKVFQRATATYFAAAGFALVFIGAFLPWARLGLFSKAGTDGDGVITLILAAFGIVLILVAKSKMAALISAIIGGLALAIGIYDFNDVESTKVTVLATSVSAEVGTGLILTIIGSLVATVASFFAP